MLKTSLKFVGIIAVTISPAFAWTVYNQNQSPSSLQQQASFYGQNNPYNNNNNNHIYSTFKNVYSPNSVRNNINVYGAHVNTYDGHYQGVIGQPVQHLNNLNSITNPYGQHGVIYNLHHPSAPYAQQKWDNPYSVYQDSYNDNAVRNSSQYGVQYQDGYGYTIGANHMPGNYNTDTVSGSYSQSPFEPNSVQNPYSKNKVFK